MEVGVDGRSLVAGAQRGVSHYCASLLDALAEAHPTDRFHVLLPADGTMPGDGALVRPNVRVHRHRLPGRLLFGAGALGGRPRLDRLAGRRLDVFWVPAPAPLAVSREVPLVLTLHDLAFDQAPGDFTPYERLWHRLARADRLARRAARVIADSAATREAALRRWRLHPGRVSVVSPGVSAPVSVPSGGDVARLLARHGISERYLLFVGALEPRKAPHLAAAAFARARARGLRAELAVVGEGRLAPRVAGPGVRLLGRLDRDDLYSLYAGALALVMPSRIEGFGFPALEAAALGTPSVVSDLPVFDETLDGGALRVPFGDVDALSEALRSIARDAGLRRRLASAGRAAAGRYTWVRAAEAMGQALREAARG